MTDKEYADEISKVSKNVEAASEKVATTANAPFSNGGWWSTTNAMTMSASVLLFGTLICVISAIQLRKGQNSDAVLRTFGTILIIVSALFLVVAGYSDRQIAPVMGLLGTIAGYLLGKSPSKPEP